MLPLPGKILCCYSSNKSMHHQCGPLGHIGYKIYKIKEKNVRLKRNDILGVRYQDFFLRRVEERSNGVVTQWKEKGWKIIF